MEEKGRDESRKEGGMRAVKSANFTGTWKFTREKKNIIYNFYSGVFYLLD